MRLEKKENLEFTYNIIYWKIWLKKREMNFSINGAQKGAKLKIKIKILLIARGETLQWRRG